MYAWAVFWDVVVPNPIGPAIVTVGGTLYPDPPSLTTIEEIVPSKETTAVA